MTAAIRSELIKLRSIRTWRHLWIGASLFGSFVVAAFVSRARAEGVLGQHASTAEILRSFRVGELFAVVLGILVVTGEFRFGSIRQTLVAQPRRGVVVGAKAVVAAGAALVLALATAAVVDAVAFGWLRAEGVAIPSYSAREVGLFTFASVPLWATIGVGIGAWARERQTLAVVMALACLGPIEALLRQVAPGAAPFLPGATADALVGTLPDTLPGAAGLVLLGLYAFVTLSTGMRALARSDVS